MNFCNEGITNCRALLLLFFDLIFPSLTSYNNNQPKIRET